MERSFIHYIPIVTTIVAVPFALQVYARYRQHPERMHLFWWALGVAIYGAGTLTEALTTLVGWQEPVSCGGVAVFPDDIVVADGDGAVLIPAALLDEVAADAEAQERLEEWIMAEVERGVPLPGLYPMNAETKARYEASRGSVGSR